MFQACPLNPNPVPLTGQQELLQDFSKRFSPAIRGVVEFAKRIPGFSLLAQDDQVTLLKAGVFEVLLVRLACMFDAQTASMVCLNGQVLKRESIHNSSNARFLMDSMFDFAERLNALRLSDAEIALFCSIVVIAADRPGLRNTELIERMQSKLKTALQIVVSQNHPGVPDILHELMKKIPDLRTLNTLHSEKLLAFKMTEQQQLQQQMQQQMWSEHDANSKSPAGSSWSSSSDVTMDEAKSPLGSVSSTESMGEQSEYVSAHVSSAPLLAATLAGGLCPHRHRANSGSTSSGDDEMTHLQQNGLTITPVGRMPTHPGKFRKLDSPSDSGIESGTEKLDKIASSTASSAPTSLCSSPRSSLEDHHDDHHHHHKHHVEDMPVLKRVLQAPPLYDTNSLMDEAYKPHKKFRALRNKDSEAEMIIIERPQERSQLHLHLTTNTQSSLSSTHSTLAKSLMEGPRMTAEQMKRTDIIHNYIMRGEPEFTLTTGTTTCPYKPSASPNYQYQYRTSPHNSTSVITTTTRYQSPPPQELPRIYFHPQSPHCASSSTSPSPPQQTVILHRKTPPVNSPIASPHTTTVISSVSPKMMELQVDIADSQQPLNLSKKSPSPSPRPASTPSNVAATLNAAVHKIVSLEA